ncbi:EexN family lipoprotein [Campylobacter geochelonis]|uniref:EexN family lipoprotein n=1 Tax=Campylobacter geochelonis TaxID=1780362 RepID=UPI00077090B9|nr:EexN family lipoprotein [Campylobacter geochelonis]CZE46454.1 Uncharacterised protein [Campylobacter geochelonis]
MKNVIIASLAVGVVLFLSGCGEEPKSVEYFMQHPDEAEIKNNRCMGASDKSTFEKEECKNASEVVIRKIREKSNEALKKHQDEIKETLEKNK